MNKNFLLIALISFAFSNQSILLLYPDADLSNTAKLNVSDVNAIHELFTDGFKTYSKYDIITPSDNPICYSSECALSLAEEYSADQVVTSKIRVLGSKIIFTGMIQKNDGSDNFATRITALNVEDMENASYRLSKSLINRDSIEDVADIDNIIKEEEVASKRRKSLYRVGLHLGYIVPFGGKNYYYFDDDNPTPKWNSFPLILGYTQNWELKSNNTMMLDIGLGINSTPTFKIDFTHNTFNNKSDNSMFYGYGIGWHVGMDRYLSNQIDMFDNQITVEESKLRHGPALVAQVGYIFMRTYNTNIMTRAKYHCQLSTLDGNIDNGITFSLSFIRKIESNNKRVNQSRSRDKVEYRFPLLELLLKATSN
tara:strand:+ start:147 stop:1247 length:1101 start_codon:yes stop_codon:yes gene_type:complete